MVKGPLQIFVVALSGACVVSGAAGLWGNHGAVFAAGVFLAFMLSGGRP